MAKRKKSVRKPPAARKAPTKGKRALADVDVKKENTRLKRELAEAREQQATTSELLKVIDLVEARTPQAEELRAIIDNAPVFLWSDLPDGYCDFLNQRWLNYFNLSLQEAQDAGWATVLHPDDAGHHLESWQKSVSTGVPFESEARFRRPDGEYRWFLTRANPLRDKTGRIVKWYGTNIDIENLKRTERRLRQSEANLAEAQRLSHTGSWALSPATTKILYWSEECYRIWGFDPVQGLPNRETVWRRIHPSDRDRMYAETQEALRQKKDYKVDFRIVLPDATVKYLEAIGHHLFSEHGELVQVVGTNVDVTERKRAEEALRESEAKIRRLVDSNIIGIFIAGLKGRVLEANDAFLHLVGHDRDDLVSGRIRWMDLTPPEWRERDKRALVELSSKTIAQPYEKEFFRKDGSRVPVLIGGALFEEGGNEGVAFVVDLTERKCAEAEARKSEQRYREVQLELAHANRVATMGQLSASITHEVNQPITAAVTYALAARRWLNAEPPNIREVDDALSLIVREGSRAGEVVARIRALIKKVPARKDAVAINDAILEVIALTRTEAANNSVSVRTQLAEGLPRVQGDRVQLQQVLLNLIINAIEAMRDVGEEERELLISTGNEPDGVLVDVRDTGPGLSPESLSRLFEPFYTSKPEGMGMGLSICRSIIEAHGGRLWAIPCEPQGALFQFTIPAT